MKTQKIVDNPLSFENLKLWLILQPPYKEYSWQRPRTCLLGQFVEAQGVADVPMWSKRLFMEWDFYLVAGRPPYTFGAALERARARE